MGCHIWNLGMSLLCPSLNSGLMGIKKRKGPS